MEFNVNYVFDKYFHQEYGVDYILYPTANPNPNRMIVNFTAWDMYLNKNDTPMGRGIFERIRMFWFNEDWQNTVYLFLRDPSGLFYSGNLEVVEGISKIIKNISNSYGVSNRVFALGSSMGGYAAMLYGFRLGLFGVIATVPRCPSINEIGEVGPEFFQNSMNECACLPYLYIEAGGIDIDQDLLAYALDKYRTKGGRCSFFSHPSFKEHVSLDLFKMRFVFFVIEMFEIWENEKTWKIIS